MEREKKEVPVPTLFNVCGKSVEDTLVKIGNNFLSSRGISFDDCSKQVEEFTRELFSAPVSRHSELAAHCLIAAKRLTYDLSEADAEVVCRNQFVIQRLVAMAALFKLRKLDFRAGPLVQESLLSFLWRMTDLEELTWYVEDDEEKESRLIESLPFLTSLKKFTSGNCTDKIIAAICENCEHLKVVEMRYETEVTDRSIDSLIRCKNLERVELNGVGVTDAGIVKLLVESQSKNLKCVEEDYPFSSNFLSLLKTAVVPFRTLPLTWFRGHDFSAEHLPLISKFFPHLECLFVNYKLAKLPDFSCLDCLEKLVAFEMSIRRPPKPMKQLYLLKSQYLTSLLISFDSEISISGLFQIGVHCPNLSWLSLEQCSLIKDVDDLTACAFSKLFQKLISFGFSSNSPVFGLEFILRHATAIRYIFLTTSSGVTDAFLTSILKFNDLKELETLGIFSGNSISVKLLKSLITSCKKLKKLCDFAPLNNASNYEFECLQNFITENEYRVKLY